MTNPTSEFPMPASGQYDEEHLIVQDSPEGIWDDAGCRALLESLEIHGVRSFCCAAVREIRLPASCHRIERAAFTACPMLERLEIHRKNVEIAEGIVRPGVTIAGHLGSTAKAYADKYGLPFVLLRTRPLQEERVRYSEALMLTLLGESSWNPETCCMQHVNLPSAAGQVTKIQVETLPLSALQAGRTTGETLLELCPSDAEEKRLAEPILLSEDAEGIVRAANTAGSCWFDALLLDRKAAACYRFLIADAVPSQAPAMLQLLADVVRKAKLYHRSLYVRDVGLRAMAEAFMDLVQGKADAPEVIPTSQEETAAKPNALSGRALRQGERLDLAGQVQAALQVQLLYDGVKEAVELDVYAFLLYEQDRVHGDADLVFFGNEQGAGGAVRLQQTGEHPAVTLQLDAVPADVQKIAVCFSAYGTDPQQNFSLVEAPVVVLAGEQPLCHLELQGLTIEKTLVAVEVYRHNGSWKLKAVGSGYQGDLQTLCESFGLTVME